jgi:hypothetical protein
MAQAVVLDFCERHMKSAQQNEMRCIVERSAYAKSILIATAPNAIGPKYQIQTIFSGKRLHHRELPGILTVEHPTDIDTKISLVVEEPEFILEISTVLKNGHITAATWDVLDPKTKDRFETSNLTCYGALWGNL